MTATLAPSACVGRGDAARWLQRYGVYVAVLVLVVFNLVFTPNFLSASNLRTGHRPGECDERSGDGVGTELDAIAAVVIGGTLLPAGPARCSAPPWGCCCATSSRTSSTRSAG